MKKIKKLVCLVCVLALTLCSGLFARNAFAAGSTSPYTVSEQNTYKDTQCDGGVFGSYACGALDKVADYITFFYEEFVARFLVIEPQLFSENYEGSTGLALREAWSVFRGFANLLLFIALIIVILSQITGFGISNYGIKKSLPKIVMGVILVNLSYIICQGCIDVANILGGGIGDFFEGLLDQINLPDFQISASGTLFTGLLALIGVGVIINNQAITTKVIIMLLLLLLVIIFAVIMLFVILAIRQALAILCVILSPVAIVCSAIPGLKNGYKIWLNTMKAVLFAYPICSALVYGGAFAASVVYGSWLNTGSGSDVMAAVKGLGFLLIATLPYFFIPSTIMKGLGVMEGLTTRVSNFVRKTGRGMADRSLLMEGLKLKDKRMSEAWRSGMRYNRRTGEFEKRFGFKGYQGRARGLSDRIANSNHGKRKAAIAAQHANSGRSAMSAIKRTNRYRKQNWEEDVLDGSGNVVRQKVYDKNGRRKAGMDYYISKSGQRIDRRRHFLRYSIHNGIGLRFANARRFNESYIKEAQRQADGVQSRALSNRLSDDPDFNAAKAQTMLASAISDRQLGDASVLISSMMKEGAEGRDRIEELFDNALRSGNADDIQKLAAFAKQMGEGELNKIKKKNPRLWNKIKYLKDNYGELIDKSDPSKGVITRIPDLDEFDVSFKNIDGVSARQFAEMDSSAQAAYIDKLQTMIEADASAPAGSRLNADSKEMILALSLAEGALFDPSIRSSLSPDHVAKLEQIVDMRRDAVEAEVSKNAAQDGQNLSNAMGSLVASSSSFQEDYVKYAARAFGGTQISGNPDNYSTACANGDTARMEAILRAIDKDLDSRLSAGGITDLNQRKAKRNEIMFEVVRELNASLHKAHVELYTTGADTLAGKIAKEEKLQGRAQLVGDTSYTWGMSAADTEAAESIQRSRAAVEMFERRFSRSMNG